MVGFQLIRATGSGLARVAGALWAASASVQAAAPEHEPVFIEVRADGTRCVIRQAELPCSEVLSHLRNVVKASPGTWIRFKADRAAPFEAVKRVLDEVAHSEYTTSAAFAPAPRLQGR